MQNDFLHNIKLLQKTKIDKITPVEQKILRTGIVDINKLLNRVKIEKKQKKKENLILSSLVISLISLVAIISF